MASSSIDTRNSRDVRRWVRAQQPGGMRRIGVLMASAADDSENQARMAAFLQGLAQLGWTDGRNVRIDTRWATTNADDLRRHAAELAALAPGGLLTVLKLHSGAGRPAMPTR